MKKINIIISILIVLISSYSQVLPTGFKLNIKFPVLDNSQKTSIIPPIIKKNIVVTPVTSNTISSNFVSDINIIGDTIWFATGKGVSRTYSSGNTFDNFYGLAPFGNDDIPGLAVYKNFVVASTATTTNVGGTDYPTGTGIKVSSDYGITWNAYPQPIDDPSDSIIIYGNNHIKAPAIHVLQNNLSYSVLITRKNLTSDSIVIWVASWGGEVRKSYDYGTHFSRVLLPPDDLDSIYPGGTYNFQYNPSDPPSGNDNHKGFALTAENDSTIYVGTAHGINKSTDWGISWRQYTFSKSGGGSGISGNFVVSLSVQRFGINQIVWGATNIGSTHLEPGQQEYGVSYSTNSGFNWANSVVDINPSFVHTLGYKDSLIYVCTDNGIWRSIFSPGNFTWSKPQIIYDEELRDQLRTTLFYSAASQHDSIWVGSGDGLARYKENTSPWAGRWKIFRARQVLNSSSDSYAAPNPFSPRQEVTRIFYKTGKSSANVTIKIFDFGMNPVRTLIQNAPRTTSDVIWTAWDGLREDGMQVANGVYFYRIQVDNETTAWGKILVLQ